MSFKPKPTIYICIITGLILGGFSISEGAFNEQINYQGKLTNTSNQAVADGSYNFRFRLCTASDCTGGTDPIWTETHCYSPDNGTTCDGTGTDQRITLTSGLFSVLLGSIASLSSVNFNQTLYLEVQAGGSGTTPSWETLTPRKKLGAVPGAFEAKQLGGYTWAIPGAIGSGTRNTGAFTTLSASTSLTTSTITTSSAALTIQTTASGGADDIIFSPAGAEKLRIEEDGDLFFEKGANDVTIQVTAPATASRTYTIPDFGGDDSFVALAATQTLTNKTLSTGSTWQGNVITGTYGGTGVNNGSYTITLGAGNFATATGAVTLTAQAGGSSVTLPASGTLATLAGSEALTNKTVNGLTITSTAGTLTIANNASAALVTSGNYSITLTATAATNATLPAGTKTLVATDVATLSSLVSVGTITTGTWSATQIAVTKGGTGLTTIAAGSILAANSADTLTAIASTSGLKVLQNSAGTISWATTTGTGNAVFASSPSLTTPSLGAATATSINGLTITTTAGTLTIANNASAALVTSGNYSITLTATAATNATLPAGTKTLVATDVATLSSLVSVGTITTGTWSATQIAVTKGGTGLTTIAAGSILAANSADTLTAIASTSGLKVLQNSAGTISWASTTGTGNAVYDNSPSLTTPSLGAATATSINITPGSNTTALTLTGTNVTSANLAYFNAKNTSGTIFNLAYGAAATLAGSLTGAAIDLSTNVTNAAQSVTGLSLALPTVTAASTTTLKGLSLTSGAVTNSAGTSTWTGLDITMPNITQSGGTLTSTGLKITGGIVTSGTSYGLIVDATAGNVGIGTTTPIAKLTVSGDILPASAPTITSVSRITTQITDADSIGEYTSIAIGTDGLPIISYRNDTDTDLVITKCGNAACSSGNTTTQITDADNVGWYTSLAIGTDGLPIISYRNATDGDLMITKCGNAACSSGNTTTQISDADNVGWYTSLAIGTDGLPVISYQNSTDTDLMITKCGNAACSSGNTTTQITDADSVGEYTSIAIGTDGLPIISYRNATDGDLMITKCGNAACSSGNTTTQITDADDIGYYTSIAIGTDGLPIISYRNDTYGDLMITKCGNAACSSGNTTTQITDADSVGEYTSIAIGTDGLPIISYRNATDGDLVITKCGNAACSSGNTTTQITDADNVGYYTSIAIGTDGLPIISYRNAPDGDLVITKCADSSCSAASGTVLTGGSQLGGWMANPRSYSVPFQTINTIQIANPTTFQNFSILTNGAERLTITPSGSVGITGNLGIGAVGGFSDAPVKLANPATLPTGTGNGASFSPDGAYLAIVHNTSPYVTIYKRSGDTFTKLSDPATLPTGTGNGASFSPDGTYLAIAHTTSPCVTIYKRSGDTFTKLADPATLPISAGYGASFSPDGTYLAITDMNSPFVIIYKRSGDTFTKLSDPATLPTGTGEGASFSPDGTYLAITQAGTPYVTIYKRSGDTFTKLANPATLPTGIGFGASFSPDGTYLAIAHDTGPYITIYKRSGDTFTKLADPATLPTGTGRGASFSPDGTYLATVHSTSPYITIYKRSGDTFTKLADPATLPASSGIGVSFSPDGAYLAVGHGGSPYVTIYKGSGGSVHRLELASGTTSSEGLGFGKELTLYRSSPGTLTLGAGGSLNIPFGNLTVGNTLMFNDSTSTIALAATDNTGVLSIVDSATPANTLLQLRDLSTNFGASIEAGAFINNTSYFGEEFNNDTLDTAVTADNATVGDNGTWYADTTSALWTISQGMDRVNGTLRAVSTNTAVATILFGHGQAQNVLQKIFLKANLPVVQIKFQTNNIAGTTNDYVVGISDQATAVATDNTLPAEGIYFTNNNTGNWYGVVRSGSANVGITASCGAMTTTATVFRTEVLDASNVRFLIDTNATDGIRFTDCGTVTGANPTAALGPTVYVVQADTANDPTIDLDYFRAWQEDASIGEIVQSAEVQKVEADLAGQSSIAQFYPADNLDLEVGTLVSLDTQSQTLKVKPTDAAFDSNMIGVVVDNPGLDLGNGTVDGARVAISGRAWVKVASGPIKIGDYLTSSSTPGVGMKATQSGRVIGIALEPYNGTEIGEIMVFINPHWMGNDLTVIQDSNGQIVETELQQRLASLGLAVDEYGVLEVGKLKAKTVAAEQIEMKDKVTGEIYCTWLENGEWVKVKSSCEDLKNSQIPNSNDQSNSNPEESPVENPSAEEEPSVEETIPSTSSGQTAEDVCDATHLNLCVAEAECEIATGFWYNESCNAEAETPAEPEEPVCDSGHLNLCTTQELCEGAGLYWHNETCNLEAETPVTSSTEETETTTSE